MGRIGIYGGTFNPPHIGHVRAAECALQTMGLDRLLVIPSCISPHKQLPAGSPTPGERLEMTKIAFAGVAGVEVSDIELSRGGSSYTWETVEQVKQRYPNDEILLFMGTDMFLSFHTWKNPESIMKNASLAVFYRGDTGEKDQIKEKKREFEQKETKVFLVENPVTEISSTQLRRLLVFGCAKPFLTPEVLSYIHENRLYGSVESYRSLSLEELEQAVSSLLKPDRVAHVLGCRQTARELAELYGADTEDAQRAALLHDVTKALDGELQLTVCAEYGIKLDSFSAKNPKTLHALTGSLVAERIFGENEAVVAAIRSHTTGKADMNVLEKIVYVADYVEPGRDFPGVDQLRSLACNDLDSALKLGLKMTLAMLRRQGREISPESVQALAFLEKTGKEE